MNELNFIALGRPQPQGSIKAFMAKGKPILTSTNEKLKPYRHTVAWCAKDAANKQNLPLPVHGKSVPVEVWIIWVLAKPKSTAKRIQYPTTKPDVDKLERAVLDALTGIAYFDDAQVVTVHKCKRYGTPERTQVMVRAMSSEQQEQIFGGK